MVEISGMLSWSSAPLEKSREDIFREMGEEDDRLVTINSISR